MGTESREQRIAELEARMSAPDFWSDKASAQACIKELKDLKTRGADGAGPYDKGSAVMTIFSGAGGDDAEDFSAMLFMMYTKYTRRRGWTMKLLHENHNDHGGFRNVTVEIEGAGVYGELKNESGVHRLVRVSPFSAKKLRHTSFSLVEVIPKFEAVHERDIEIKDDEIRVEFARAGGPGGQNVNKRETAVRIVHLATNLSVHVTSERSQHDNRVKGMAILRGKLYKLLEDERRSKEKGMYVSKTTSIEWGSQIRSYVLHPYKMVKDHRTNIETVHVDKVLDGELDEFIEAERHL